MGARHSAERSDRKRARREISVHSCEAGTLDVEEDSEATSPSKRSLETTYTICSVVHLSRTCCAVSTEMGVILHCHHRFDTDPCLYRVSNHGTCLGFYRTFSRC